MQTQYVLGHRNDLYFHDYKLAIKIDEDDCSDRNNDYEIKRQKAIDQKLGYEVIRIGSDKKFFLVFLKLSMKHLDTNI